MTDEKSFSFIRIVGICLVLALIPGIYLLYLLYARYEVLSWHMILVLVRNLLPYYVALALHHFLLLPQKTKYNRSGIYLGGVLLLLVVFVAYSHFFVGPPKPPSQQIMSEQVVLPPPFNPADIPGEPVPPHPHEGPHPRPMGFWLPGGPLMVAPEIGGLLVLLVILCLDAGLTLGRWGDLQYQRLQSLEMASKDNELRYLRAQINPHFLMNSLNTIHALIDDNPEQAKQWVVRLSKIMRYSLYDTAQPMVDLSRDIQVLDDYIDMMRSRVTEHVDIRLQLPDPIPEGQVAPMVLTTFVENAFKHGISYQQPSFVHVRIAIENNRLVEEVSNSRFNSNQPHHTGIGLDNTRRRLDLLYANDYTLEIDDQSSDTYTVKLNIPIR